MSTIRKLLFLQFSVYLPSCDSSASATSVATNHSAPGSYLLIPTTQDEQRDLFILLRARDETMKTKALLPADYVLFDSWFTSPKTLIAVKALSYNVIAMTAHVAIVFMRYMMLAVENRESEDPRTLGELFTYFMNEMADVTFFQESIQSPLISRLFLTIQIF